MTGCHPERSEGAEASPARKRWTPGFERSMTGLSTWALELSPALRQDLERLGYEGIPVDVVFQQGPEVLK